MVGSINVDEVAFVVCFVVVKKKKNVLQASLVVETGQAWSTHHFACLVGYGASAVHPYLAYQSVLGW